MLENTVAKLEDSASLDAKLLQKILEKKFGVSLLEKNRKRDSVDIKRVFGSIMRERGYTYSKIGQFIGKDHSTIMHYDKTLPNLLTDNKFKEKYEFCRNRFFKRSKLDELKREAKAKDDFDGYLDAVDRKMKILELEVNSVNAMNDYLVSDNNNLKKELGKYNNNLSRLYKIISERTKPNTEELIERRLNALYNGVYDY